MLGGVVVPIPTFPLEFQIPVPLSKYASPDTVSAVVDAYGSVLYEVAVEVITPEIPSVDDRVVAPVTASVLPKVVAPVT